MWERLRKHYHFHHGLLVGSTPFIFIMSFGPLIEAIKANASDNWVLFLIFVVCTSFVSFGYGLLEPYFCEYGNIFPEKRRNEEGAVCS